MNSSPRHWSRIAQAIEGRTVPPDTKGGTGFEEGCRVSRLLNEEISFQGTLK